MRFYRYAQFNKILEDISNPEGEHGGDEIGEGT